MRNKRRTVRVHQASSEQGLREGVREVKDTRGRYLGGKIVGRMTLMIRWLGMAVD